jgi:hypothetical protein
MLDGMHRSAAEEMIPNSGARLEHQSINESVPREPKTVTADGRCGHHRIVGISDLRDNTGNRCFTPSKIWHMRLIPHKQHDGKAMPGLTLRGGRGFRWVYYCYC